MLDIHKVTSADEGAREAAGAIIRIMQVYREVPVLFLVSGGSPLSVLHYVTPDVFDARVTLSMTDERFNSDPNINNFSQMTETAWYQGVITRGVGVVDTRPKEGTVQELAWRMQLAFANWHMQYPGGAVVITQGVGKDGHTVGMMPYPEDPGKFSNLFDATESMVVGYDAGNKNQYSVRATVTLPFLRNVNESILYMCGPDKQVPLTAALASEGSLAVTPARIIHEMKHCLLYTDCAIDTVKKEGDPS